MCRLFGMISVNERDCTDYLVNAECSLLKQSHCREGREQKDGWGIGYYSSDGNVRIIKSAEPVFSEVQAFKRACERALSKILLAHVRAASNPRNLPREKLVSVRNSQPFFTGRYIFIHNGTITIPDEIAETLGNYKQHIMGTNDSEVLFWLFMKYLRSANNIPVAFSKTVTHIWEVWNRISAETRTGVKKRYGFNSPYIGLNCMVADGKTLYAFCRHDGLVHKSSLCYGDQPYFQLCYAPSLKGLVVASEKMNRTENWHLMDDCEMLRATVKGERVCFDIETWL